MLQGEANVYPNVRNTLVIETAVTPLPLNVNKNVLHQQEEANVCHNVGSIQVIKNVATHQNVNKYAWMLQEEVNVYLNVRNTLVIEIAVILLSHLPQPVNKNA